MVSSSRPTFPRYLARDRGLILNARETYAAMTNALKKTRRQRGREGHGRDSVRPQRLRVLSSRGNQVGSDFVSSCHSERTSNVQGRRTSMQDWIQRRRASEAIRRRRAK